MCHLHILYVLQVIKVYLIWIQLLLSILEIHDKYEAANDHDATYKSASHVGQEIADRELLLDHGVANQIHLDFHSIVV